MVTLMGIPEKNFGLRSGRRCVTAHAVPECEAPPDILTRLNPPPPSTANKLSNIKRFPAQLNQQPERLDDAESITIATIRLLADEVSIVWLPQLFAANLSPDLRRHIAERMRFHANSLESGELETILRNFADHDYELLP